MGLDVHDVGGCLPFANHPTNRLSCKLRCGRTLQKNMVMTVEPGCYFIDSLLDQLLSNAQIHKYVNKEMLQRFCGAGGVRIESDVIVTEDGIENMTKVPRYVKEIERTMNNCIVC